MSLSDVPATTLSAKSLLEKAFAFRETRILLAAAELGVFAELGKGPRSRSQLCRALHLKDAVAPAFFDALVSLGFLDRDGEGARAIYLNTREGTVVLNGAARNSVDDVLQQASRFYGAWNDLAAVIRKQHPATPAQRVRTAVREFLADLAPGSDLTMLDLSRPSGLLRSVLPPTRRARVVMRSVSATILPAADLVLMASSWPRSDHRLVRSLLSRIRRCLRAGGCFVVIDALSGEQMLGDAHPSIRVLSEHVERACASELSVAEVQRACSAAGFIETRSRCLTWPLRAVIAYKDAMPAALRNTM